MISDTPFAYLISKPPLIQINLYLSKAKAKVSAVPFCCAIISSSTQVFRSVTVS